MTIPFDVIYYLERFLPTDPQSLAGYCILSRHWLAHFQKRLYTHVRLSCLTQVEVFRNAIVDAPHLRAHVTNLEVRGELGYMVPFLIDLFAFGAEHKVLLHRMTTFSLVNEPGTPGQLAWTCPDAVYPHLEATLAEQAMEELASALARVRSLTTLRLLDVAHLPTTLVGSCAALTSLTLGGVWAAPILPESRNQPVVAPQAVVVMLNGEPPSSSSHPRIKCLTIESSTLGSARLWREWIPHHSALTKLEKIVDQSAENFAALLQLLTRVRGTLKELSLRPPTTWYKATTADALSDASNTPLPKLQRLFIQLDHFYFVNGYNKVSGSCMAPLKHLIRLLVNPRVVEVIDILIPFTDFDCFFQDKGRRADLSDLDKFLCAFTDDGGSGSSGYKSSARCVRVRVGVYIAPGIFEDTEAVGRVFCGVALRYINAMPWLWEKKRLSFLQVSRPAWPPLCVVL